MWWLLACAAHERMPAGALFEALATQRGHWVVVDVRSEAEWRGGHIPGALHLPYPGVRQAPIPIRPDQELVLVCLSGHRSIWAMDEVKARLPGIRVRDLDGGMISWWGAGYPTER